jgi:hypothetical protein
MGMTEGEEKLRLKLVDELIDHIGLIASVKAAYEVTEDGLLLLVNDLYKESGAVHAEYRHWRFRADEPDASLSIEGKLFDLAARAFLGIEAIRTTHER